mmetsp:Transcript_20518/g.36042  ORF Transcript_20518/g.36042 Transcript_20518/m.36042 type:complete len:427 (+) Transcript_20518:33-1313(+)
MMIKGGLGTERLRRSSIALLLCLVLALFFSSANPENAVPGAPSRKDKEGSNEFPSVHNNESVSGTDSMTRKLQSIEHSKSGQLLWGLKVLYIVPMYNFKQYVHTELMMGSVRDMCEAGAKVSFVLQTTESIPGYMTQIFKTQQYCANPAGDIQITVDTYDKNITMALSQQHRQYMYDRLERFDLFVYAEDDMHVRPAHLALFLREMALIERAKPDMWDKRYRGTRYLVGNIRWESALGIEETKEDLDQKSRIAKYKSYADHLSKIRDMGTSSRVYWENYPHWYRVTQVAPGLGPYMTMDLPHTAMWVLHRRHLKALVDICGFDSAECGLPDCALRLWVSMNQLRANVRQRDGCGLVRVIPVDQIRALGVHHLPDKNWRRKTFGKNAEKSVTAVIGADEIYDMAMKMAKKQNIKPRDKNKFPEAVSI